MTTKEISFEYNSDSFLLKSHVPELQGLRVLAHGPDHILQITIR